MLGSEKLVDALKTVAQLGPTLTELAERLTSLERTLTTTNGMLAEVRDGLGSATASMDTAATTVAETSQDLQSLGGRLADQALVVQSQLDDAEQALRQVTHVAGQVPGIDAG